ncbi:MAG: esterase [Bacteroidetes bacterium]|nr:esterase [Bacteroidota bacterium]
MNELYHNWFTPYLRSEFEMLVFGTSGIPVILFPTERGRFFEAKDSGMIDSVKLLLDRSKIKIYCPDSIDDQSWCNNNIPPDERVKKHVVYEKLIIKDVIEFAQNECNSERVILAGCGLGGYNAFNLTFRHPEYVSHLFCILANYNIKKYLIGHYDDNCYFNNPPDYLPGLTEEWFSQNIQDIHIVLGTHAQDYNFKENLEMSSLLNEKGVRHWLKVHKQGTGWDLYRRLFAEYLSSLKY